jgi:hypothetical protein
MLICRGGTGGPFGNALRGRIIVLLLRVLRIARRASPKSTFHEKCVQMLQRAYRNARRTQFHRLADGSVDHPVGQRRDDAGSNFNMQHIAVVAAASLV